MSSVEQLERRRLLSVTVGGSPTTIVGTVYDDLNFIRIRDPNEPPLQGWAVFADLNANGAPDIGEPTAATAADGSYTLSVPRRARGQCHPLVPRHDAAAGSARPRPDGRRRFALTLEQRRSHPNTHLLRLQRRWYPPE